jgi:zinc-binding alcohol dehydrogenase family protein
MTNEGRGELDMTDTADRMNAVVRYEPLPATDPRSLVDVQVPRPVATGHDVLIQVEAVSVNPADVKSRANDRPTPEGRILGYDGAGTVVEVGPEVTLFGPGDEVWWAGQIDRPGSDADFQLVDERIVGRKPETLDWAEAAAMPLTTITAWESLFDRLRLNERSRGTLLVAGATGGVGSMILQLAEILLPGATTIATSSNADGDEWVRSLGADAVVNYRDDMAAQLKQDAPEGVDWIFTSHSRGQIGVYAEVLKPFGHIVAIDDEQGQDLFPLKAKSITWHWELMFTRPVLHTPDMIGQHALLDVVADLVDDGHVRTTLTRKFTGFDAATLREAHAAVEKGDTLGKVVVAR